MINVKREMKRCEAVRSPLFGHNSQAKQAMQRHPLRDAIKMTLSQLLTQIAALAPIRVHTLPKDPEAMQPTRPTRRGRPMGRHAAGSPVHVALAKIESRSRPGPCCWCCCFPSQR